MTDTVKLAKLKLSPINVRTSDNLDIEPLAAGIAAKGILQNLLVTPSGRSKTVFEVFDGGRRLRALQLLAADGTIDAETYDVPVKVIKAPDAERSETSLLANFTQLRLTPAEECRAFQHFIGEGRNITDVAKIFGQTVRFVEGRLRLASLATPIFDSLADGMLTLEKAKAYPALSTLAIRGVAHDEAAKSLFHADGKKTMRRLADALGLEPGSFDLRSNRAHASRSGEITLHGDELWVQLSLSELGPGHEVTYRRVRGRHDQLGERDRSAPSLTCSTPSGSPTD